MLELALERLHAFEERGLEGGAGRACVEHEGAKLRRVGIHLQKSERSRAQRDHGRGEGARGEQLGREAAECALARVEQAEETVTKGRRGNRPEGSQRRDAPASRCDREGREREHERTESERDPRRRGRTYTARGHGE